MSQRAFARELAAESVSRGKPLEWFEALYCHADGDESVVPWADMTVNPNLTMWLERNRIEGTGRKALIVGCGLGDDAEALASLGFQLTAFDISPTCIEWCQRRFPNSPVEYSGADLFSPPSSWQRGFDFVFEAYTLQVLPEDLRSRAISHIVDFVAMNGTLLVIARGRSEGDNPGKMPWPLMRSELAEVSSCGLKEANFEDYVDTEDPPVRRFRIEYRKSEA